MQKEKAPLGRGKMKRQGDKILSLFIKFPIVSKHKGRIISRRGRCFEFYDEKRKEALILSWDIVKVAK